MNSNYNINSYRKFIFYSIVINSLASYNRDIVKRGKEGYLLKKFIHTMLIAILVFSSLPLESIFATGSDVSNPKKVTLYLPNTNETLTIYQDEALTEALTNIKNKSDAVLLEESQTGASLVEVVTENDETIQGYIQNDAIVQDVEALFEEYKLYSE